MEFVCPHKCSAPTLQPSHLAQNLIRWLDSLQIWWHR